MLFLAVRHLLSRKKQTLLILLGISLGTTMYVVISGMQLGMREFTLDRLLQNIAHIRISARDRAIDSAEMTDRFFGPSAAVRWIVPPSGKREEAHIVYPQGWFDSRRYGWGAIQRPRLWNSNRGRGEHHHPCRENVWVD